MTSMSGQLPGDLPLLIGLGPVRSGTSWVHELLFGHSQVATTAVKEVNFFSAHHDRGLAWYRQQFTAIGPATRLLADISPYYMLAPEMLPRVRDAAANPRFLVNLRSPYERVLSWYRRFRQGQHRIVGLATDPALTAEATRIGCIAPTVERCIDCFGYERITLLRFEDLQRDPVATAQRLQHQLGLDVELPPSTEHRINGALHYRSTVLRQLAHIGGPMVRFLSPRLFYLLKFSPLHNAVFDNCQPLAEAPIGETIAAFRSLSRRFERDIDAIERLFSLDLSAWRCDEQIARLLLALASPDLAHEAGRRGRSAPRGSAIVQREG
jgi:hypothetical protein